VRWSARTFTLRSFQSTIRSHAPRHNSASTALGSVVGLCTSQRGEACEGAGQARGRRWRWCWMRVLDEGVCSAAVYADEGRRDQVYPLVQRCVEAGKLTVVGLWGGLSSGLSGPIVCRVVSVSTGSASGREQRI
jgi:hypothetical protein